MSVYVQRVVCNLSEFISYSCMMALTPQNIFFLSCTLYRLAAAMRRFPGSFVLTAVRGQLVMLQGIWFIQIAEILFKGEGLAHSSLLCYSYLLFFQIKAVQDVPEEAACLPSTASVPLTCSVWADFVCVSCGAYPCSLCVGNVRHKTSLEPYEVT